MLALTKEITLKNVELMSDIDLKAWREFYRVAYGQARKKMEPETVIDYFRKAYGKIIIEFEKRPDLDAISWAFDDLDEGPVEQLRSMTEEEMKLWWLYSKSSQLQLGTLGDAETLRSFFRNLDYEIDFKFGKHIGFVMHNVESMSPDEDLSGWTNFYRIAYRQARKQEEPKSIINYLYVSYHEFNNERRERSHITYSSEEGLVDGPAEQLRLMTGEKAASWLRYSKAAQMQVGEHGDAEYLKNFFKKVDRGIDCKFITYFDLITRNIELMSDNEDWMKWKNFYKIAYEQALKRGEPKTVIDYFCIAYHEFKTEPGRRLHVNYRLDRGLHESVKHIKEVMDDWESFLWRRYSKSAQIQLEGVEDYETFRSFFRKIDDEILTKIINDNYRRFNIEMNNLELMSDEDLSEWANFYKIAYGQARKRAEHEIIIDHFRKTCRKFEAAVNSRATLAPIDLLDEKLYEGSMEQLDLMDLEEMLMWFNHADFAQRRAEEHGYPELFRKFFQKIDREGDFGEYVHIVMCNVESMSDDEDLNGWADFYRIAYRHAQKYGVSKTIIHYFRVAYIEIKVKLTTKSSSEKYRGELMDRFSEELDDFLEQLELTTSEESDIWLRYSKSAQVQVESDGGADIFRRFFRKVDDEMVQNR